jgi:hypothetical protein
MTRTRIVAAVVLAAMPMVAFAQNTFVFKNPLKFETVCGLTMGVLDVLLNIGIYVALFFIVRAGVKFVTAQGNEEKLRKAKDNFFYTIVGVALFLGVVTISKAITATINQISPGAVNTSCK